MLHDRAIISVTRRRQRWAWKDEPALNFAIVNETHAERVLRERRELMQQVADLQHKLDVAERTAKAAANLLLRKTR